MRDLVSVGAIDSTVLLSRDGGAFFPLEEFDELRGVERQDGLPPLEGDLKQRTFFSVFYLLRLRQATGKLTCSQGDRTRDVYVERGEPTFIASNRIEDRFGEFLVARGVLSRKQLEVVLASTHTDKGRIGQTLIRLGFVQPHVVFEQLREQQITRLTDVCAWDTGTFKFQEGERYTGDKFELGLETRSFLLRAAREIPEVKLIERLDRMLGSPMRTQGDPDKAGFDFSGIERGILPLLDGSATAGELLSRFFESEARRRAAVTVIYLLWEAGYLRFDHAP